MNFWFSGVAMNGELRALLVCVLAHVHQLSGETNVGQFFSILKNDHLKTFIYFKLQEQAISRCYEFEIILWWNWIKSYLFETYYQNIQD